MRNTTQFLALRALLADLGWSDASTDTDERLSACGGQLGLTVSLAGVEFWTVDPNSNGVMRTRVTGEWTYGSVVALAHHFMIVHIARGA